MRQPTDDITIAAIDMVRRTGCLNLEFRQSDPDKPKKGDHRFPIAYLALAYYNTKDGLPQPANVKGKPVYIVGAGPTPTAAILHLLETIVDGGTCIHCSRPTGFEPEDIDTMPLDSLFCWLQYDPETKLFRPGCGGAARAKQENP